MVKRMKKTIKIIIIICLAYVLFSPETMAHAASDGDAVFEELYFIKGNGGGNGILEGADIFRCKLIDEKNHIYIYSDYDPDQVLYDYPEVHGDDVYSGGIFKKLGFSGVLTSETAYISKIRQWTTGIEVLGENINKEYSFYLKDPNSKHGNFLVHNKDQTYDDFPDYVRKEGNNFNVPLNSRFSASRTEIFTITVVNQGVDTDCYIILDESQGAYWKDREDTRSWRDSELYTIPDTVDIYIGDEKDDVLSDRLTWQYREKVFGFSYNEGTIANNNSISVDPGTPYLRVSYRNDYPETVCSMAFSNDLPNIEGINDRGDQRDMFYNYHFYRNKTKMVCVNDSGWHDIHNGSISQPLPLKDGLNIIFIAGTSTDQIEKGFGRYQFYAPSYIYFIYCDKPLAYSQDPGKDTGLKEIECYQAAYDIDEGRDQFSKINILESCNQENVSEKHIAMNADLPYVWLNIIPEEETERIDIEGATKYLGGYYLKLNTSRQYFDINITAEDGSTKRTERIFIDWTGSAAELKDLQITFGGNLETGYDSMIRSYYCEKDEDAESLKALISTKKDTSVSVYVDRELQHLLPGEITEEITVDSTVKEIQCKVVSSSGKSVLYTIYLNRDKESGVSSETKRRAKALVSWMERKGYLEYLANERDDYWKTFGAASLGKSYLKGLLGYDVTQKTIRQASDCAGIILELIMSGENPYDYLGIDYVDRLMEFNENGNFGAFSANIWALAALQAAGAEVPNKTVEIVLKQAKSRSFDLDMRGWALYASALYKNNYSKKEYAELIASLKEIQIQEPTMMNKTNVTGVFENFFYTNRNIMSHACVISGLTALGIDTGGKEFKGRDGSDPISILENYRVDTGWFYSPENKSGGGWNKDVVIAVGDLLNGENVYQRYYLTNERYNELISLAENYLEITDTDPEKGEALRDAYEKAIKYSDEQTPTSTHGKEYFGLQEALYSIDDTLRPGVFLGTSEERDQVNEVKEGIERISDYSYADKKDLDQIKEKYDALGKERLYHYIRNSEVLDKAYSYIRDIDNFIDTVDNIGTVNLTKTAKIKKARKAYDALSDRQKEEDVVNEAYRTLLDAEAAIIKMNDPDKVERAIRNLGSIVTLDLQDDIEAVREAYDSLSDADKTKVTNVEDLEKAEENLRELLARETAIDNAVAVAEKIASIGDVSRNSEDAIRQAREAYDALETEEEKNIVSNYRILLDSETEYANLLDREELGNALSEADYHINRIYQAFGDSDQLGEDNCQDVSEAVEEAGRFFEQEEEKRTDFCQMVSGYPSYVDVRAMIAEYTFDPDQDASLDNLEGILDSIGDVTLDREPDVRKAEMILETLRASDETSDDLGAYETRISSLREGITAIRDSYPDICSLVTAIESVGEVSQTYQDAYLEAANLYNNAEEALISRIPATAIETITAAGNKYGELREEMEEISRIEGQIEESRQASSLLDEEAVVSARDAYEGSGRKESISNYLTLLEAEKKIVSLKKAAEDAQIAAERDAKTSALCLCLCIYQP